KQDQSRGAMGTPVQPIQTAQSSPGGKSIWAQKAAQYQDVLAEGGIPVEYHCTFTEFVETGNVSPGEQDFLDFLEGNPEWQKAVEKAFIARLGALQKAIRALKGEG